MRIARVALALLALGWVPPLVADGTDNARAVFSMICTREALSLGHRGEAIKTYVDACVAAKMKVYDQEMADPATAHIPKAC
jgi:hypothetical protein